MLQSLMRRMQTSFWGVAVWSLAVFGIATAPVFADNQQLPKLKIVVKAGDGATNNVKQRLARELIVQVNDENDRPVSGAAVLFTLPDSGAGGTFGTNLKTFTTLTDLKGQAAAKGFNPNAIVGKFKIEVNATYQGQMATASIVQANVMPAVVGGIGAGAAAGISAKVIAIVAVVGAAAAAGGVAAVKSGSSESAKKPTSITPGTPSITP